MKKSLKILGVGVVIGGLIFGSNFINYVSSGHRIIIYDKLKGVNYEVFS